MFWFDFDLTARGIWIKLLGMRLDMHSYVSAGYLQLLLVSLSIFVRLSFQGTMRHVLLKVNRAHLVSDRLPVNSKRRVLRLSTFEALHELGWSWWAEWGKTWRRATHWGFDRDNLFWRLVKVYWPGTIFITLAVVGLRQFLINLRSLVGLNLKWTLTWFLFDFHPENTAPVHQSLILFIGRLPL